MKDENCKACEEKAPPGVNEDAAVFFINGDSACTGVDAVGIRFRNREYELSFAATDILRVRLISGDKNDRTEVLAVCPQKVPFSCKVEFGTLKARSGDVFVEITPNLALSITRGNSSILSTPEEFMTGRDGQSEAKFNLLPDERIYGLGQDPMARLDQRDRERRMWNQWSSNLRSGNCGIGIMLSSGGYAILLNSTLPARFCIGKAETAEHSRMGEAMAPSPWDWRGAGYEDPGITNILLDGDGLDLFIIIRESFDARLEGYAFLTGYPKLLPKWAYGYLQCKNRYMSGEELLFVAREFRRRKIPCDALIIDWLWFEEFGDLAWDRQNWPEIEETLGELERMGLKAMNAQHPFISDKSENYDRFMECNYLNKVPPAKRITYDHSNPEARAFWWQLVRKLYEQGIRGYWTDMGELEEHFEGTESFIGGRAQTHNAYSMMWAKGLYEGQRKDFGTRLMTLVRSGCAGIQRYGTALWSGDIDSSWEVLKTQVVVGQGVCLSGIPWWTTDIGGFLTCMSFTPELYIRWLQWGVFCPLFRTHGTRPGNEPWSFGPDAEEIITDFIRLRYRLMPYIYSCAAETAGTGRPLMRAMCMDFPEDVEAAGATDQYLFGPFLLIAPVTEKGGRKRKVYLPEGIWYDFWTDRRYSGPATVTIAAPIGRIPVFVRAGGILPMCEPSDNAENTLKNPVVLHVYPGAAAKFNLYDDDGSTYAYETGDFTCTEIRYDGSTTDAGVQGTEYPVIFHAAETDTAEKGNREPSGYGTRFAEDLENQGFPELSADADLSSDGTVTVTLLVLKPHTGGSAAKGITNAVRDEKSGSLPANEIQVTLKTPVGWNIRRTDRSDHDIDDYWKCQAHREDTQRLPLREGESVSWTARPASDALPLLHRAVIAARFSRENDGTAGEQVFEVPVEWGNGAVTRMKLLGCFENRDDRNESELPPENDPELPFYQTPDGMPAWIRDEANEYNCFGYVDFRRLDVFRDGESINGIAYAKSSVWSPAVTSVFLNLRHDGSLKLWLNDELVYGNGAHREPDIRTKPVKLKHGWNSILVKVAASVNRPYSGGEFGFSLRITDDTGGIPSGLLIRP